MTNCPEDWIPLEDKPEMWWRIVCTYDGKPDCVCAAIGSTAAEAEATLLDSLAEPHLAVIEEVSPMGVCEALDVLEELWG
jgi:hypothetical protein